jgi:hypothetical protein
MEGVWKRWNGRCRATISFSNFADPNTRDQIKSEIRKSPRLTDGSMFRLVSTVIDALADPVNVEVQALLWSAMISASFNFEIPQP